MIHRDAKTQNVLLTTTASEDMTLVTKVSDFGTVREDLRSRDQSSLPTATDNCKSHATTDNIIGTRPYMPVEYILQGHVSEKTDTFSFGVLLVELFTTTTPRSARWVLENREEPLLSDALVAHPGSAKLGCPGYVLHAAGLGGVADRCTVSQHKRRSSVAQELPELERLYQHTR
jgi:serine/threonine protein kinase